MIAEDVEKFLDSQFDQLHHEDNVTLQRIRISCCISDLEKLATALGSKVEDFDNRVFDSDDVDEVLFNRDDLIVAYNVILHRLKTETLVLHRLVNSRLIEMAKQLFNETSKWMLKDTKDEMWFSFSDPTVIGTLRLFHLVKEYTDEKTGETLFAPSSEWNRIIA